MGGEPGGWDDANLPWGCKGAPSPGAGREAGEEAVIRHQHLQSRGRKRDHREMLASLTVYAISRRVPRGGGTQPFRAPPEQCPAGSARALCPQGAGPHRSATGNVSPGFQWPLMARAPTEIPKPVGLQGGCPSREVLPAPVLPFPWQWGIVVPGWRSCIDRQKSRAGLESYS